MSDKEPKDSEKNFDVPVVGHEYDGIQEFNNPAPFWWQLFFYLSIFFGVLYYVYYELGDGQGSDEQIAAQMQAIENIQWVHARKNPIADQDLTQFVNDSEKIKAGKEVYLAKCAACHTPDGGGLVGPNLTDAHWLHGKGEIKDIYSIIDVGVPDKGMPPWGPILTKDELIHVAVFVKTLQGTHPVTPKAPQGEKVN